MSWWMPGETETPCVMRRYPPRTDEETPEFMVMAMPQGMREANYLAFLRTPTLESTLK